MDRRTDGQLRQVQAGCGENWQFLLGEKGGKKMEQDEQPSNFIKLAICFGENGTKLAGLLGTRATFF